MKPLIFAANWKLNKNPQQTRLFFNELANALPELLHSHPDKINALKVLFFPPASSWEAASESVRLVQTLPLISWGAQNVYTEKNGAFTGENSMQVLFELGGRYSLVGHSERRLYFKESNEFLNKKIVNLQECKITPVYCIGESLQERESGITEKILEEQLRVGLLGVSDENLIVAYEPVWAIGTGKVATSEQVKSTHAFVKKVLIELKLSQVPILYGGSVKAENSQELIHLDNVNGFLVGGASLEVKSFAQIIDNGLK